MHVAFIVHRLSNYRLLGAVIDCALAEGWRTECWHDYGFPSTGPKHYLFPDIAACPRFRHGRPHVRAYRGPADLVNWLEREDVDAVVSISPLQVNTAGVVPKAYPMWTCLQSGPDTFSSDSDALEGCDLLALHSPWWLDWGISFRQAVERVTDADALRQRLEPRTRFVGFPESECLGLIDRESVRRRLGLPPGRPVVTVLPFPQGVGRRAFWPKKVFGEPSRARRLFNIITHREFGYLPAAWHRSNDVDVCRALRGFCDRHDACLVVKSRAKTPIPDYLRALADACVYDEAFYPPTILDVLSVASLCVSYYSLGVLESSALGVPHLCVTYDVEDYLGKDVTPLLLTLADTFLNPNRSGVFQFGNVSRALQAHDAIALLQRSTLDDFRLETVTHNAYRSKFLGPDDGRASSRTLDAIAEFARSDDVERRRSEWRQRPRNPGRSVTPGDR